MPTGIMNNTQAVSLYAYKNNLTWDRVQSNADGNLKVNIENSNIAITTDGSTLNTNDTTTHTKLDGVNSNLSGLATQATLASVDTTLSSGTIRIDPIGTTTQPTSDTTNHNKLDTINTSLSGLATQSTLASIDSSLSGTLTISGNVTDTTTHTKLDGVNSNLSGLATQATLSNIEASHYANGDAIAATDTGILVMGRDNSNNAHPLHITQNGDVEVEIADFVKGQALMAASFPVVLSSDQSDINIKVNSFKHEGSTNNIENNSSISSGAATSLSADISNMRECNIIVEDTNTASYDGYNVEISGDNGTTYFTINNLYPVLNGAGTKRFAYASLNVGGLDLLRLRNSSATDTYTNVNASVFGSP